MPLFVLGTINISIIRLIPNIIAVKPKRTVNKNKESDINQFVAWERKQKYRNNENNPVRKRNNPPARSPIILVAFKYYVLSISLLLNCLMQAHEHNNSENSTDKIEKGNIITSIPQPTNFIFIPKTYNIIT